MIIRLSLSTLMAAAIGLAAVPAMAQPAGAPTLRPTGGGEPRPLVGVRIPAIQKIREPAASQPPANGQVAEEKANDLIGFGTVEGESAAKPAPRPKPTARTPSSNRHVEAELGN